MFESDEEAAYDDGEYANKIIQLIRCAYLDNEPNVTFTKTGNFTFDFVGKNGETKEMAIRVSQSNVGLSLNKATEAIRESALDYGFHQADVYRADVLDFGKVKIALKVGRFSTSQWEELDYFQQILFPTFESSENVFSNVWYGDLKTAIQNDTDLTGEQIEKLRNIANCESRNFSISQKIDLIDAVASKPGLFTQVPESREDIILDLIENIKTDDLSAYHQDFLEALLNKPGLLSTLFEELDNVRVAGNEDNADRFAQILFTFWSDSKYDDIDNAIYTYSDIESRKNYGSSPLLLSYEGDELIVNRDYTSSSISFSGSIVSISGSNKPFVGNIFDEGWEDEPFTIRYHPFQPVWFVKESDNTTLGPDNYIPAIVAFNMIRNGNYENTMRDINLGVDVILTFTAFGNFTKLKHLSKLQQGAKWVFGGLELGSSALDISLRYTDWCKDDELCKAMQNYNSYLQLRLLVGEVLSASYKQLLKKKFDDTKEVYNRKRATLEDRLGKDSEDLEDADELFGAGSSITGDISDVLRAKIVDKLPAVQAEKLIAELSTNSALKSAKESGDIIPDAWKWIDDNIPTLPQGQPSTYVNYLKKKTVYLNQASDQVETVTYYRAQIAGIDGPEEIITITDGNVNFGSSYHDWLNFSTDNIDHAKYFKDKNPGSYIVKFEMPKSFDVMLKENAIPQWGAAKNKKFLDGLAPQIADPNQPGNPFTTRKWKDYWRSEFQQNVIQGSGEIIK